MKIVVVGGSASNVGKTTLAARLIGRHAADAPTVAVKVSVREQPCETAVVTLRPGQEAEHRRDSGTLLDAGADCVVWVTVHRAAVRAGLARGLATARSLRPATVVMESTSAGIELRRITDSWFVAGDGEWKPWADRHRKRADHVVRSGDLFRHRGDSSTIPASRGASARDLPLPNEAPSTFLSPPVEADGYVHVDARHPRIAPGDPVRAYRLP